MKSTKEKPFPEKSAAYNEGYIAGLDPHKKPKDNPYRWREGSDLKAPMISEEWYEWFEAKGKKAHAENDKHVIWKNAFACGRRRLAQRRKELKKHEILDAEYELYANLNEELNQRG